jgi:hypothetical protein
VNAATTNSAMTKWRQRLDSDRQRGLETTLTDVLMVVESGGRGERIKQAEFFILRNWERFACSSTTKEATEKWRPQLDSKRQIGPEIPLHGILMVVGSGSRGGNKKVGGIFPPQNLGMFLHTSPQPAGLWRNGGYSWIQLVG